MTATVTKKSVKYVQEKKHNITFNLILTDGVEVLNQDFSVEYRLGDSPSQKVSEITDQMNEVIARYKNEKQIFTSAALDNAVTQIQGGIIL